MEAPSVALDASIVPFPSTPHKRKRKFSTPNPCLLSSSASAASSKSGSANRLDASHPSTNYPHPTPQLLDNEPHPSFPSSKPSPSAFSPPFDDVSMSPSAHPSPTPFKRRSLTTKFRAHTNSSTPVDSLFPSQHSSLSASNSSDNPFSTTTIKHVPSSSSSSSSSSAYSSLLSSSSLENFKPSNPLALSNFQPPCSMSVKNAIDLDSPFKYPPRRLAFTNRPLFSFPSSLPDSTSLEFKNPSSSPSRPYSDPDYCSWGESNASSKNLFSLDGPSPPRSNAKSFFDFFPRTSTPKSTPSDSIGPTPMILSTPDCVTSQQHPMECKPSPFYKPELYKPSPDRIIIDDSEVITPPSQAPVPLGLRTPRRPSAPKTSPLKHASGQKPSSVRRLFANLLEQSSLYSSTGAKMESPSLHPNSPKLSLELPSATKPSASPSMIKGSPARCPSRSSSYFEGQQEDSSPLSKKMGKSLTSVAFSCSRVLTRSAAKQCYSSYINVPPTLLEKPSRGKLIFKTCDSSHLWTTSPSKTTTTTTPQRLQASSPLRSMSSVSKHPLTCSNASFASPYHLRKTPQRELRSIRQSNSFFTNTKTTAAHCI